MGKQGRIQIPVHQLPLEKRLKAKIYNAKEFNAAIHGQGVPGALGLDVARLCVIHGVRHHHGFAQELRGVIPEFTRALNARDIMSGIIPEMDENNPDEVPYCIWHPDTPPEDTLRTLVQRYPTMIYHAARACAVAGYIDLYKDLAVLPEVHVAEEACDASASKDNKGSEAIYQDIMAHAIKYAVMDDYSRTVDVSNPRIKSLNGDTATSSSLAARQVHKKPELFYFWTDTHDTSHYFNITEDWGVDDHECAAPEPPQDNLVRLLHSPLPADLPPVNKDLLILLAAFHGDIDRYVRLRRPKMIKREYSCVIRGIHHNVFWAKWWSLQVPELPDRDDSGSLQIRRAINARRIMSDDITCITDSTPMDLVPMNIWWPARACSETYVRLAHKRPDMLSLCLRACIVGNDLATWNHLLLFPVDGSDLFELSPEQEGQKIKRLGEVATGGLYREARDCQNPQYLRDISSVPGLAEKLKEASSLSSNWISHVSVWDAGLRSSMNCKTYRREVDTSDIRVDKGVYDGEMVWITDLEFALFARDVIGPDHKIWENPKKLARVSALENEHFYELLETGKTGL